MCLSYRSVHLNMIPTAGPSLKTVLIYHHKTLTCSFVSLSFSVLVESQKSQVRSPDQVLKAFLLIGHFGEHSCQKNT